jgi:hypothetical protein
MKKEMVFAGVAGGLAFGIVQSFTMGVPAGVFMGLFFGIGMSLVLTKFVNSKTIKDQVDLPDASLLPGEVVLLSKQANLVIDPKQFGLQNFAFGDFLWAVGMKDKESLGGAMHLTNYRIIFKSHRWNRLRGMTSIFLPTIERLENRSVLVFPKLAVATKSAEVEFVVSDVDDVRSQIASASEQIDESTLAALQQHVSKHWEKCSDGLQSWDAINRLNDLFNLGKQATEAARVISNPFGALGAIFMSELLDRSLVEKCQQVYRVAEQRKAQSSSRPAA